MADDRQFASAAALQAVVNYLSDNGHKESLEALRKAGVNIDTGTKPSTIDKYVSRRLKKSLHKPHRSSKAVKTPHSATKSGGGGDDASGWTAKEIDLLEKALKTFALVTDKNERFKAIARVVQSKTKKQCYEKYKELQKQGEGKQEPKAGKDSAARVKVKAPLGVSQTTVADLLAEDISGGRKSSTFSASKASADSWNSLARHVGIEEAQPPRPTQPSAAAARRSLSHRGEIVIDDSDDDENEGAVVEDIRPATAPTRSFPSRSGPPESFASFDRPPEASWSSKQRAPSRESKKAETLSLAEVGIEDEIEEDIAGLLEPTLPSGGHALASGLRITPHEALTSRICLFGSDRKPLPAFNEAWQKQGFHFSKVPNLGYGLIQNEGGPCGPLAVVQAKMLRYLMFPDGDETVSPSWSMPSADERTAALVQAISDVIWVGRSSHKGTGKVAIVGSSAGFTPLPGYKRDGFTEALRIIEAKSKPELASIVKENLSYYRQPNGPGLISVVLSAMLSRGLSGSNALLDDFDSVLGMAPKLIGSHNYAAQEMVNLMMFGRAYSNVFNGEKVLADDTGASTDQIVLRGVPFQSEIGFLTLFEHYKSIEVGRFFKNPRYPVWVVCSESHYSVLFGLDPALTKGIPSKAFDLYYYDPLGKQEEVYRLTVDPHPQPPPDPEQLNSIHNPPIDHVIRTRWPGAVVDWNGSEALL